MKILYHHRTLSKDGQNVHIDELIAAFRRLGHTVEVAGPTAHAEAEFGSDGGFSTRLRAALPRALAEILEWAYSAVAFRRLWGAYRRVQPDFLYERYNLFLMAGVWLKRLTGVPFVLEINAPLARERRENSGLSLARFAGWCERRVWRYADLALPVTEVLAQEVEAAGVPRERIVVLHNGVNQRQFAPDIDGEPVRRRYGLGTRKVIGFSGFLRDWHGLPVVLDVMKLLRDEADLHFLVVGDGPARAGFEQSARELGLSERVTVTGVVPRAEMPGMIAAFDIALQPKATAYASPLKLFEYMGQGRAIVAPTQPNVCEILEDGVNALMFTPGDWDSFAVALRRLITEPGLAARLGQGALATVRDRDLTWDGNASLIAKRAGEMRHGSGSK